MINPNDDLRRYGGNVDGWRKAFMSVFRKAQQGGLLSYWYRLRFKFLKQKHGIEIYYRTKIGKGLYLGHPWGITINADVVIADNCNIHKGVTIGQENRGKRKGTPVIGNKVYIGINAIVCGKITIGDDVMIAPGAFVNCDVPSHSIVIGNPCVIKHKENATEGYINNCV